MNNYLDGIDFLTTQDGFNYFKLIDQILDKLNGYQKDKKEWNSISYILFNTTFKLNCEDT